MVTPYLTSSMMIRSEYKIDKEGTHWSSLSISLLNINLITRGYKVRRGEQNLEDELQMK